MIVTIKSRWPEFRRFVAEHPGCIIGMSRKLYNEINDAKGYTPQECKTLYGAPLRIMDHISHSNLVAIDPKFCEKYGIYFPFD